MGVAESLLNPKGANSSHFTGACVCGGGGGGCYKCIYVKSMEFGGQKCVNLAKFAAMNQAIMEMPDFWQGKCKVCDSTHSKPTASGWVTLQMDFCLLEDK